jgi:colicin import membrane protein
MPRPSPTRTRRTKAEVEREFTKLADDVAAQRAQADPKHEELARQREAEIRQTVGDISVAGIVQHLSSLGMEVSRTLSELSNGMVKEFERLTELREAVSLEVRELERLHKIDLAATALDQLVQDYQKQKAELEAEIESQRAAWKNEELERQLSAKEQDDNLKKQRQREIEDFEYKKALERKKAQDKYDEDVRLLEKKNKEKQETLEKSWQQREAALKEREEEWARLRQEVDVFPARLKKELDSAVAAAVKAADQRSEQQALLVKKDAEADKRVAELQVKSLQESAGRQAAEIESLRKQLDEAKRQVQEIAVKAIEGASGAQALTQINKIAMEQAKTRAPQA